MKTRTLAKHQFVNNKAFRVSKLTDRWPGVPKDDKLMLTIVLPDRESAFFLRADEAVLLAKLLIEAVYKSVEAYRL